MAVIREIRQGDIGWQLQVQAVNADSTPIPAIPLGATVQFIMVHRASQHRYTGAATISGGNRDILTYVGVAGDSARVGPHDACFKVSYPGGEIETFPTCSDPIDGLVVEVCRAL